MKNILGPQSIERQPYMIRNAMCVISEQSPFLIDYQKSVTTPYRKIGHITYFGDSLVELNKQSEIYDKLVQVVASDGANSLNKFKVGIVMGSISDYTVMKSACEMLKKFQIEYEVSVVSAHRTPDRLTMYAQTAHERGIKVIIAGAGGAAHLPGMLASNTTVPVIGVPIKTQSLSGMDSLYSIVQMPPGVPVACMSIDGAGNAALYALQIAAINSDTVRQLLHRYRTSMKSTVYESCLNVQ
jgi:5-(carboxyamino)imidazole ribonucleotide mutase